MSRRGRTHRRNLVRAGQQRRKCVGRQAFFDQSTKIIVDELTTATVEVSVCDLVSDGIMFEEFELAVELFEGALAIDADHADAKRWLKRAKTKEASR